MKKVYQNHGYEPERGLYGDCHSACVASILELDLDAVPVFSAGGVDDKVFFQREREFLLSLGYVPIMMSFAHDLGDVLDWIGATNPNTYYILGGMSQNNRPHSVVGLNDQIIHDPGDCGIVGPLDGNSYWATFFGAINTVETEYEKSTTSGR